MGVLTVAGSSGLSVSSCLARTGAPHRVQRVTKLSARLRMWLGQGWEDGLSRCRPEPDAPRGSGIYLQAVEVGTVGLLTLSQGLPRQQSLEVNHFIPSALSPVCLVVITMGTTGGTAPPATLDSPGVAAKAGGHTVGSRGSWLSGHGLHLGGLAWRSGCPCCPLGPRQANLGGHCPAHRTWLRGVDGPSLPNRPSPGSQKLLPHWASSPFSTSTPTPN